MLVLAQQSLVPEDQTQWKRSAYKKIVLAESMKTCAVGKKIQSLTLSCPMMS